VDQDQRCFKISYFQTTDFIGHIHCQVVVIAVVVSASHLILQRSLVTSSAVFIINFNSEIAWRKDSNWLLPLGSRNLDSWAFKSLLDLDWAQHLNFKLCNFVIVNWGSLTWKCSKSIHADFNVPGHRAMISTLLVLQYTVETFKIADIDKSLHKVRLVCRALNANILSN